MFNAPRCSLLYDDIYFINLMPLSVKYNCTDIEMLLVIKCVNICSCRRLEANLKMKIVDDN